MELITGKTIKGRGLGSKLGFPTLNLAYTGKLRGVFAGKVFLKGEWHDAAVNLGGRPTIDDDNVLAEAFLIDWSGKIRHGTTVEIKILNKIREIKKFKNLDELKEQIARDVECVKYSFSELP